MKKLFSIYQLTGKLEVYFQNSLMVLFKLQQRGKGRQRVDS